jgi:hypothetical protein
MQSSGERESRAQSATQIREAISEVLRGKENLPARRNKR